MAVVKKFPAWLSYTLLRLGLILVPLAILLVLTGYRYWPFDTIAAVLIGLALSYIFLKRPRAALAEDIHEARTRKKVAKGDDAAEDAAVDAAE